MTGALLWRGMLAGMVGALLSALFALAFAEPQIDRAIAFEASHAAPAHHAMPGMAAPPVEEELVSRATQKGAGLFTAMLLYGAAVGGLFALVFAYGYGRAGPLGPRTVALLLALAAFVVIALVPALKYPPTPPAVGQHETVRLRTAAFFGMIALSLFAAIGSLWLRRQWRGQRDAITVFLLACGSYVLLVAIAQATLPVIDEVPADFPATVLWQFRLASIGAQAVLWLALGITFGSLAERCLLRGRRA
ncbi:CbtA family protein [Sphingomonas solaris]|uniref:CbtA family protein n=1 Tax=Alterirhizorhabdus solaris TaxID=2529389 RepID=A0A558QXR6_9SPHN|nr:CbtA family protein [Sphingomonas solaris]TVV71940.1 CbtA family protein [Sphingomonas solaris]